MSETFVTAGFHQQYQNIQPTVWRLYSATTRGCERARVPPFKELQPFSRAAPTHAGWDWWLAFREPLDRRYITTRRVKPSLERAGLPQIRFHDLGHTCATLLLTENVNPKGP